MSTLTSKYYGNSRYLEAKRIEDFRELSRWFESPSYMTPPNGKMPVAEIGLCACGARGKWYEFLVHAMP